MSVVESTGVGRICIDTVKGVVPESTGNLQRHVLFSEAEFRCKFVAPLASAADCDCCFLRPREAQPPRPQDRLG